MYNYRADYDDEEYDYFSENDFDEYDENDERDRIDRSAVWYDYIEDYRYDDEEDYDDNDYNNKGYCISYGEDYPF